MSAFKTFRLLLAAGCVALAAGCAYQPYENVNTWLMRDNAIPQYFANYDIFFVHRGGFDWEVHDSRVVALYDSLKMNVKEPFGRHVRVFAPLLHDDVALDEVGLSLGYYLDTFHDDGRPYVVFVEGRDAAFLEQLKDEWSGLLKRKNGMAYLYGQTNGTIYATDDFRAFTKRRVDDLIYERRWHREHPPEDLARALDLDVLAGLPLEVMTEDAPSMRDSFKRIPLKYKSATNKTAQANMYLPTTNAVQATQAKPADAKPKKAPSTTYGLMLDDMFGKGEKPKAEAKPATEPKPAAEPKPLSEPVQMSMGIPEKVAADRAAAEKAEAERKAQEPPARRQPAEEEPAEPERVDPPGAQNPEPKLVLPMDPQPKSTDPRPSIRSAIRSEADRMPTLNDLFKADSPEMQIQGPDPIDPQEM